MVQMRIREQRNCFKCDTLFSELFRYRFDERGNWVMVYKKCLEESKKDDLFYEIGGAWKAKKIR